MNEVPVRLRGFAKGQRSAMPRAEALLWNAVRAGRLAGLKFRRQVPITPYVVDFLCVAARVIVELDGKPHEDPEQRRRDIVRERWLTEQGFCVLRFANDEVLGNCDLVIASVLAAVLERVGPSPAPLRGAPSPAEGERVGAAQ